MARFANNDGQFIAISHPDLNGLTFKKWWRGRMDELGKSTGKVVYGESYWNASAISCELVGYRDVQGDILYKFFERNGKAYCTAISGTEAMPPDQVRNLFQGWRWIKK